MANCAGRAAIGHVRYATCGKDDLSYAQPFERHHLQKHKWFSFGFNGQLANYAELRDKLLADDDHHLARATDTEIIMHEISRELSGDRRPPLVEVMHNVAQRFDGAYCIVLLNALGEMVIARDPLGIAAALLRDRRTAPGRGQRKRRPLESRLLEPQHPLARAGRNDLRRRPRDSRRALRRQLAAGPLLLRVDLLRQRRQHARRPQRLSLAQSAGRRARAARDGADRRRHGRRARARHEQVRGRRDGLPARRAERRRADSQPLFRPHLHRRRRQPDVEGPVEVHAACAKCSKASACCWSKTRSSARRRCGC